jgi:hypothetical protein
VFSSAKFQKSRVERRLLERCYRCLHFSLNLIFLSVTCRSNPVEFLCFIVVQYLLHFVCGTIQCPVKLTIRGKNKFAIILHSLIYCDSVDVSKHGSGFSCFEM